MKREVVKWGVELVVESVEHFVQWERFGLLGLVESSREMTEEFELHNTWSHSRTASTYQSKGTYNIKQ